MVKKMFITDFDGVLCDSVDECILSSYNAHGKLYLPAFRRIRSLDEIDPEKRKQFRALRPYIRSGEDYILIFWALEKNISLSGQEGFDRLREERKEPLSGYQAVFYEERDFLLKHERELWLSLNPLFDGIGEALNANNVFEHMRILTTKREDYVLETLHYHGIAIAEQQITFTTSADKINNLLKLLESNAAKMSESVFVEDQVKFLVESQKHQIRSYLVNWSYITEAQRAFARQHTIPIIDVAEFSQILCEGWA